MAGNRRLEDILADFIDRLRSFAEGVVGQPAEPKPIPVRVKAQPQRRPAR